MMEDLTWILTFIMLIYNVLLNKVAFENSSVIFTTTSNVTQDKILDSL